MEQTTTHDDFSSTTQHSPKFIESPGTVPPIHESKTEDEETESGYGWVCVACQLLIVANTWGVNGSFGVYLSHYLSANTFPGTSEVSYAFIGGLAQSQITLLAPLVTYSVKRIGTKKTLFIGVIGESGALVAASFASQAWHLFLTQGLLFGWGCSFLFAGTIGIIPQWFNRRRGLANGVAVAGSGLGGMAYSLGSDAMIRHLGIAWSFRITAICAATVNTVCSLLIRDRNKDIKPNQHGLDVKLLKQPPLIAIILWAVFSIIGYTVILFSLPNDGESIGLTTHQSSILGAVVNLGMALGRPAVGLLGDHYGRVRVAIVATLAAAVFCYAVWIPGTSYPVLLTFAILGGSVMGTVWVSIGTILADNFGKKALPAYLSIVWTLIAIPSCFAEAIALELRTKGAQPYLHGKIFAGSVFVASALFLVLLPLLQPQKSSGRISAITNVLKR